MNKVKGVECSECKDKIWSRNRHDYRSCSCGKTTVDGGSAYLKYSWDPKIERPKVVEIETEETQTDEGSWPY